MDWKETVFCRRLPIYYVKTRKKGIIKTETKEIISRQAAKIFSTYEHILNKWWLLLMTNIILDLF